MNIESKFMITSRSFENGQAIPKKHTGFGEDISPALTLHNLSEKTVTLAVLMEDLDIPFVDAYPHWLIWNLPKMNEIPEDIPYGEKVATLQNAVQGVGYGKNRYRGPKQPFFVQAVHRYRFTVYALDCRLDLYGSANKSQLLQAMEGHILQEGNIMGVYQRKMNHKK